MTARTDLIVPFNVPLYSANVPLGSSPPNVAGNDTIVPSSLSIAFAADTISFAAIDDGVSASNAVLLGYNLTVCLK